MRGLIYRALSGLLSAGQAGMVQSDATGRLSVVPGGGDSIPAGIIVMWSGLLASVPAGWALCDGQNGTPDLRSRFIKGWTDGVDPGATGGAATHQHTYTQVLNHTHPVVVNDPGHAHVENSNNATTGPLRGWAAADTSTNTSTATGYSTATATTGVTATTSDPAGGVAEGITAASSNEPPYFQLAYIIKL